MACEITIDPDVIITATEGGEAFAVTVSGTAIGCLEVAVTLKCGSSVYEETAQVDEAGTWTREFADVRCECGGLVLVDAVCKDEECSAPTFSGTLDCPARCPEIREFSTVGDHFPCTEAQTHRTIIFNVHIVAGAVPVVAHIQFEDDVVSSDIELEAGEDREEQYSHSYSVPRAATTVELIIDQPEGCPSRRIDIPALEECECPSIIIHDIHATPSEHCVDGKRNVALEPVIEGEGAEHYHWFFGADEEPDQETIQAPASPATTHAFLAPGRGNIRKSITFAIAGPVVGLQACLYWKQKDFDIEGCEGTDCPSIARILAEVGECTEDGKRRVSFDAEIEGEGISEYLWDFGNGASERIQGRSPDTHEDYETFGPHTVTLTITGPEGCEPYTDQLVVDIPACGRGEGWGCIVARWVIIALTIMASLALWIAICVPMPAFFWFAGGFALAAAIVTGIWLAFCDQPCAWGLLLGWQIALGVGICALYYANCCPWLWGAGAGSIALAVLLFAEWRRTCQPTFCHTVAQLGMVITVVIIPVMGWLANIPGLAACMNPMVAAAVGALGAAVGIALVACADGE
jgi:hypothetical protein